MLSETEQALADSVMQDFPCRLHCSCGKSFVVPRGDIQSKLPDDWTIIEGGDHLRCGVPADIAMQLKSFGFTWGEGDPPRGSSG